MRSKKFFIIVSILGISLISNQIAMDQQNNSLPFGQHHQGHAPISNENISRNLPSGTVTYNIQQQEGLQLNIYQPVYQQYTPIVQINNPTHYMSSGNTYNLAQPAMFDWKNEKSMITATPYTSNTSHELSEPCVNMVGNTKHSIDKNLFHDAQPIYKKRNRSQEEKNQINKKQKTLQKQQDTITPLKKAAIENKKKRVGVSELKNDKNTLRSNQLTATKRSNQNFVEEELKKRKDAAEGLMGLVGNIKVMQKQNEPPVDLNLIIQKQNEPPVALGINEFQEPDFL